MKIANVFLSMAKDEAETLQNYQNLIDSLEGDITEEEKAIADEIMSDEFNHCLVCLLSAAKLLDIKIATDDLSEDPNNIEVKDE